MVGTMHTIPIQIKSESPLLKECLVRSTIPCPPPGSDIRAILPAHRCCTTIIWGGGGFTPELVTQGCCWGEPSFTRRDRKSARKGSAVNNIIIIPYVRNHSFDKSTGARPAELFLTIWLLLPLGGTWCSQRNLQPRIFPVGRARQGDWGRLNPLIAR